VRTHQLPWLFLCFMVCCFLIASVQAKTQKFIYVYNSSGELLTPANAADQCPDPNGGNEPSTLCQGVEVVKGKYKLRFNSDDISQDNLVVVANHYQVVEKKKSDDQETYVLLESKRRIDKVKKNKSNHGLNVNELSESVVRAVERVHRLPRGRKGHVDTQLSGMVATLEADALNATMGNAKSDNVDVVEKTIDDSDTTDTGSGLSDTPEVIEEASTTETFEQNLVEVNQEKLATTEQEILVDLAVLAVENQNDVATQDYIRKSVIQGLIEPELLDEVSNRVFSHIANVKALSANGGETPVIVLEADKYTIFINEMTKLSTEKSISPEQFFAYSWNGVDSESTNAAFTQSDNGSYLVCVSGEISDSAASSTDCVRLLVKNVVEPIARAETHRTAVGSQVKVSGSLSLGATKFAWTGPGQFEDSSAEATSWVAPDVPGSYELSLTINDQQQDTVNIEVFDILPVAIAQADNYSVFIEGGQASTNLASGSIATNGSEVDSLTWTIISYPEGSQASLSSMAGARTQFITDTVGYYEIELTANKGDRSDAIVIDINVRQQGVPVADAGLDLVAFQNVAVKLDGSRSVSTDSKTLSYTWSANGGMVTDPNEQIASFSATETGVYHITLMVFDGEHTVMDAIQVDVKNQVPISSDTTVDSSLSEVVNSQLIGMDGDSQSLTYRLVSEPESGGVTLDSETGEFTYVPGGAKGCLFTHDNEISDTDGQTGRDVPVIKLCADKYVVAAGEEVHLFTSKSINAAMLSGYHWVGVESDTTTATFSSMESGTYQVCVVGNIGQSKNTSTACVDIVVNGSLSTPPATTVDSGYVDQFQFVVSDGENESSPGTINVTIDWQNTLPIANTSAWETTEDNTVSGTLSGSDSDEHQRIIFHVVENGAKGIVEITDAATGSFIYTPNKNETGLDQFTFKVNDGLDDSLPTKVNVDIAGVNDMPVAYFIGEVSLNEDTSTAGVLTASDPDEDTLEYRLVTQALKGTVVITDASTGAFTYTPFENENGADSFHFLVHDGNVESNVKEVPIAITPVNDTPVAEDLGPLTTHADEAIHDSVAASDIDRDALVYRVVTEPSKGTLVLEPTTGEFVYTPKSLNDLGEDSFTFTANDVLESDSGIVTINILAVNNAPVAESQSITVIEGVAYGGVVNATDADDDPLSFAIQQNPELGSVMDPDESGSFVYTPIKGLSGDDYFSYLASDDDKTSDVETVQINIITAESICNGIGDAMVDQDGDGYADYVEAFFGTGLDNAESTPDGLDAASLGLDFENDDDNDGYQNYVEIWIGTDPNDKQSLPSASTLKKLPDCMSEGIDYVNPLLHAFKIVTPTLDARDGTAVAEFLITTMDNATGIKKIFITLTSPSGREMQASYTASEDVPVVYYGKLSTDAFSAYAEQGTWSLSLVTIIDGKSNELTYDAEQLTELGYTTAIAVTNPNGDITPPTLDAFSIDTPVVQVQGGAAVATFSVTTSDDVSGIAHINVKLMSPSGMAYRWGDVFNSGSDKTLSATINTNPFEIYAEANDWQVETVEISDHAGNVTQLDTVALKAANKATIVSVVNANPDTSAPVLTNFTVLTPSVDVTLGNVAAGFSITAEDDAAGIAEIVLSMVGPSQQVLLATYSALDNVTELTTELNAETFDADAEAGDWVVVTLSIIDGAGNITNYVTNDIKGEGYSTTVTVESPDMSDPVNQPPVAFADSFTTDEDSSMTGKLRATDADANDVLNYQITGNASKGLVTLTDSSNGEFLYEPNKNAYGRDSFTFTADDGTDESLAIITVNLTPQSDDTVANDMTVIVTQNIDYSSNLQATDPDGEDLVFTIVENGSLGTVTLSGTSRSFIYVPKADALGEDQFTFQASDSNSISEVSTVSITIEREIQLQGFEVLTPRVSGLDKQVPMSVGVSLNKDPDEFTEVRLSLMGPSGQTVSFFTEVNTSEYPIVLTKIVDTTVESLEIGTWTFSDIFVKQAGDDTSEHILSDISAEGFDVSLEVVPNTSPTADTNINYLTSLGQPLTGILTAMDPENDKMTYRIVSTDSGQIGTAKVVDEKSGGFEYVPYDSGVDTFSFIANDGLSGSTVGTVTVTINDFGVPVAFSDQITAKENTAFIGMLPARDPDEGVMTYRIDQEAGSGTVSISDANTGEYVYRPNPDTQGSDTFTFIVNDGSTDSNVGTISVTIEPFNLLPVPESDTVVVFKDISYTGTLAATDAEGDDLMYQLVTNGGLGTVELDAVTGQYMYTPFDNMVGSDYFLFSVTDGAGAPQRARVDIRLLGPEQACGTGGLKTGYDQDGDGYADYVEAVMATDPNDASSVPENLAAREIDISYTDDDDADGVKDYVEVWLGSDPFDADSMPEYVLNDCFNGVSDGIKPRMLSFNIATPVVEVGSGETTVSYQFTLVDNASGMKRARVSLTSPSGAFVTSTVAFEENPLVSTVEMDVEAFGEFAEEGTWTVAKVIIYDQAGNRLDVTTEELRDGGFPVEIQVNNSNGDSIPPSLDGLAIVASEVYPGATGAQMGVQVTASDADSGVSSMRVDFMSISGKLVTASKTLATATPSVTLQLDTPILSEYLEAGIWTISNLLLVDGAGNSIQMADQLEALGLVNSLLVTNPAKSDTTAPTLESFTILITEVYPAPGTSRMEFAVTAYDDLSGVASLRVDIVGPSGQILTAWKNYAENYPVNATAQVRTATLDSALEEGTWQVNAVELFDEAGNSRAIESNDLIDRGFPDTLQVLY